MNFEPRDVPAGYIPGFVCTLETCSVKIWGYIKYQPSIAGNSLFLAIFALAAIAQLWLGRRYRTRSVYVPMIIGLGLEVFGYVARLLIHGNPFYWSYFIMYLVPLTLGPAFFAAAIYVCLGRIVVTYGKEISWLQPKTYTWMFVGCDFVSLVVQSVGGAIAATAPLTNQVQIDLGTHILVAGLSLQVASLTAFTVISIEFGLRVLRNRQNLNPQHAAIYNSRRFKIFLCSLALAVLCIFTRSVFRSIELSGGFTGHLANDEVSFMVLDGVMVIIAVLCLTVAHPGRSFGKDGWAATAYPFVTDKETKWTPMEAARRERIATRREKVAAGLAGKEEAGVTITGDD